MVFTKAMRAQLYDVDARWPAKFGLRIALTIFCIMSIVFAVFTVTHNSLFKPKAFAAAGVVLVYVPFSAMTIVWNIANIAHLFAKKRQIKPLVNVLFHFFVGTGFAIVGIYVTAVTVGGFNGLTSDPFDLAALGPHSVISVTGGNVTITPQNIATCPAFPNCNVQKMWMIGSHKRAMVSIIGSSLFDLGFLFHVAFFLICCGDSIFGTKGTKQRIEEKQKKKDDEEAQLKTEEKDFGTPPSTAGHGSLRPLYGKGQATNPSNSSHTLVATSSSPHIIGTLNGGPRSSLSLSIFDHLGGPPSPTDMVQPGLSRPTSIQQLHSSRNYRRSNSSVMTSNGMPFDQYPRYSSMIPPHNGSSTSLSQAPVPTGSPPPPHQQRTSLLRNPNALSQIKDMDDSSGFLPPPNPAFLRRNNAIPMQQDQRHMSMPFPDPRNVPMSFQYQQYQQEQQRNSSASMKDHRIPTMSLQPQQQQQLQQLQPQPRSSSASLVGQRNTPSSSAILQGQQQQQQRSSSATIADQRIPPMPFHPQQQQQQQQQPRGSMASLQEERIPHPSFLQEHRNTMASLREEESLPQPPQRAQHASGASLQEQIIPPPPFQPEQRSSLRSLQDSLIPPLSFEQEQRRSMGLFPEITSHLSSDHNLQSASGPPRGQTSSPLPSQLMPVQQQVNRSSSTSLLDQGIPPMPFSQQRSSSALVDQSIPPLPFQQQRQSRQSVVSSRISNASLSSVVPQQRKSGISARQVNGALASATQPPQQQQQEQQEQQQRKSDVFRLSQSPLSRLSVMSKDSRDSLNASFSLYQQYERLQDQQPQQQQLQSHQLQQQQLLLQQTQPRQQQQQQPSQPMLQPGRNSGMSFYRPQSKRSSTFHMPPVPVVHPSVARASVAHVPVVHGPVVRASVAHASVAHVPVAHIPVEQSKSYNPNMSALHRSVPAPVRPGLLPPPSTEWRGVELQRVNSSATLKLSMPEENLTALPQNFSIPNRQSARLSKPRPDIIYKGEAKNSGPSKT